MEFAFIARPFGALLKFLYDLLQSYGVALIVFTLLTKIVLLPFQMKSKKSMLGMQRIQPKMKDLEKKYKDDKERYAVAVTQLYKDEGVSMMGGCLPLLLTLPIMFGLYTVVRRPLTYVLGMDEGTIRTIADQVGVVINGAIGNFEIDIASKMPNGINFNFLGLNLGETPKLTLLNELWIIPILSGVSSYLVSWVSKKCQPAPTNNKNGQQPENPANTMTMLMPIMSTWIAFIVPLGLGLYWVINNLLTAVQEPLLTYYYTKKFDKKQEGKK